MLGLLTVLLASRAPAKRASKSSPLAAALGNTTALPLLNKAANTGLFRIDTALGIRHTLESQKIAITGTLLDNQLARMITTEATAYAITGSVLGTGIGLFFHYVLFSMLISSNWGDAWSVPVTELGVILVIIVGSVVAVVSMPIKRISRKSIVDTINAH